MLLLLLLCYHNVVDGTLDDIIVINNPYIPEEGNAISNVCKSCHYII